MGKRKRETPPGHPCNQRFPLTELGNMEVRYDGKRLHVEPGRRVRPHQRKCPCGIVDAAMYEALRITDAHLCASITTVIEWCASTWPEMEWDAEKLPYKVIAQTSHSNLLLVFHWPPKLACASIGALDHAPPLARKGWVEWTTQWRLVVPVSI